MWNSMLDWTCRQYVGLDVSLEQTSVCVVDASGKTIWQGKCASTPEAVAVTIRIRAPEVTRIGLESGPLSAWHWHELKKLGLPVDCLDARHAKAALSMQLNKSDRNDVRGLAQIVRTGWHREVMVKGMDSQLVRSLLTTRARLVRMRVDLPNQIRGVLKPFGLVAGKGGGQPFVERVRKFGRGWSVAGGGRGAVVGLADHQRPDQHTQPLPDRHGSSRQGSEAADDGSRRWRPRGADLHERHRRPAAFREVI